MADYKNLKKRIIKAIGPNGERAITGQVLQDAEMDIISVNEDAERESIERDKVLDEKIKSEGADLSALTGRVSNAEEQLVNHEERIQDNTSSISNNEQEIARVEGIVDGHSQDITDIKHKDAEQDSAINTHTQEIAENKRINAEQGEAIANLQEGVADAAHTFDATELVTAIGKSISAEFKEKLNDAILANKWLYAKSNGIVYRIVSVGNNGGKQTFTSIGGKEIYNVLLDNLAVSLKVHKIGGEMHIFNNNNGINILNLDTSSTNDEIQSVFTDSDGEVVIPNTGDIFNIHQNSDVAHSGIVVSETEDAGGIRLAVEMSNFEDNLIHRVFYNIDYTPSKGFDSLNITNKVDNIINPSLLTEDKINERNAEINASLATKGEKIEQDALICDIDKGGHETALSYNALRAITICGYPLVVFGHGTPSATNMIDEDMKALGGSPAFRGQFYINLDARERGLYYAKGSDSVSDWINA